MDIELIHFSANERHELFQVSKPIRLVVSWAFQAEAKDMLPILCDISGPKSQKISTINIGLI